MNAPDIPTWMYSPEAEQSTLGAILLDNTAYDRVADLISGRDFFVGIHRKIFEAAGALIDAGSQADMVSVGERLQLSMREYFEREGGIAYIAALAQNTPSALNVRRYAEIVRERSLLRQLNAVGTKIQTTVAEFRGGNAGEILDAAQAEVMAIGMAQAGDAFRPLSEGLTEAYHFIDEMHHRADPDAPTGLPYGFIDLDRMTSGMHPGQLIVIAARPSMGKSAFALNICENAVRATGKWALFFTIEMGLREQALRMLASGARVNVQRLAAGRVNENEWKRLTGAVESMQNLKLAFNEQAQLGVGDVRSQARRAIRELGPACAIVVDYLQLMLGSADEHNRVAEISEITRGLKLLGKELGLPVIALSQLSRAVEARGNKRPIMSDLRDSGSIEQDADVILFIYRDVVYNAQTPEPDRAEIIISKQRNGPVGSVDLRFRGDQTRFENSMGPA